MDRGRERWRCFAYVQLIESRATMLLEKGRSNPDAAQPSRSRNRARPRPHLGGEGAACSDLRGRGRGGVSLRARHLCLFPACSTAIPSYSLFRPSIPGQPRRLRCGRAAPLAGATRPSVVAARFICDAGTLWFRIRLAFVSWQLLMYGPKRHFFCCFARKRHSSSRIRFVELISGGEQGCELFYSL